MISRLLNWSRNLNHVARGAAMGKALFGLLV
jgi:hypothetical protein